MANLSTLSTLNLNTSPKLNLQNQSPSMISIEDIWKKYFAGNHSDVLNEGNQALFMGHAPDYLHVCGLSLCAQGRLQDALPFLKSSVLLYPLAPSWFVNCAIASLNAGAANEALEFALSGLKRHESDPILYFSHGNALMHLNRLEEAQVSFTKALSLKPNMSDARLNLGNVLRRMGKTEEALSLYNQVLNAEPNNGLAMVNRAGVLIELNEHDEAAMLLLRIMAVSEMPEVSFMMAMLRLMDGDFKNGFDLYRSRFDCAMAAPDKAQFKKPLITSLSQASSNHVLVAHEQGFGDSLQFIRYLPMLVNHAKKVTLMVPKSLHRLFERVDNRVRIVETREQAENYDIECPMLHIPFLFETTLETIPNRLPYLSVSHDVIAERKLPRHRPHTKKRVGLVWAGQLRSNPDLAAVDRRRSLSYSHFEPLMSIDNIDFVSLQLGDPANQIFTQGTKGVRQPHQVLSSTMDFLDTAAIVMQLDLVVTVDTAVAHLAGALGKPVWVLSRFDQCWRWLKNRDDSPWYPDVMRLFRQETRGDWTDVLRKLHVAIDEWASQS